MNRRCLAALRRRLRASAGGTTGAGRVGPRPAADVGRRGASCFEPPRRETSIYLSISLSLSLSLYIHIYVYIYISSYSTLFYDILLCSTLFYDIIICYIIIYYITLH